MQTQTEAAPPIAGASLLAKVTYRDSEIQLECYADMYAVIPGVKGYDGALAAIRFGGYPEHVRGLSEAIRGGGTVEIFDGTSTRTLKTLENQYDKQLTAGSVYAEAALFVRDEPGGMADDPSDTDALGMAKQTTLELPPRKAYLFCPVGDDSRLFEEIDKRTRVPLIPEFQEYLLDTLKQSGSLKRLSVVSPLEPFDAWELSFTKNENNIIRIVEDGLKQGHIQIPGAAAGGGAAFRDIQTVSQYLQAFGKEIAERIKSQFEPLYDPDKEPLSEEIQYVNRYIEQKAGYQLYPAQLAVAEAAKRTLDKKEPVLVVAECGAGKSAKRS